MSSLVEFYAVMHPAPGKEERLKSHLLELASHARAEDHECLTYQVMQLQDPQTQQVYFMILERWPNQAAIDRHLARPWRESINQTIHDDKLLSKEEIIVECKTLGGFTAH